jgi:hypothetical protein
MPMQASSWLTDHDEHATCPCQQKRHLDREYVVLTAWISSLPCSARHPANGQLRFYRSVNTHKGSINQSMLHLTDAAKSTTAFSHEQKALLNWQATLQHLQQHNTP